MSERVFQFSIAAVALVFAALFCLMVVPALIQDGDIVGAFAAGFVNPYASGYSSDVVACWAILALWVVFEARTRSVRHGWVCLVLGVIPGVAVGFAGYLLLRSRQLGAARHPRSPHMTSRRSESGARSREFKASGALVVSRPTMQLQPRRSP
jgi:hypothetical protein